MRPGLEVGATSVFRRVVRPEEVVPLLFPDAPVMDGMPHVLASAYMIGMFEWACVEQVAPYYDEGEGSLGTGFELTHVSPTPPGLMLTIETVIESFDGKFLWFKITGHDGQDMIGEGRHQRALVKWDRFNSKVKTKLAIRPT